ncbi:hypothetical protein T484DRAFT_1740797 [Baffinella frigidus]|nr:hypothetical protein T484DRAFT_1740797 [Cryptophyta sp. CCMP2293]
MCPGGEEGGGGGRRFALAVVGREEVGERVLSERPGDPLSLETRIAVREKAVEGRDDAEGGREVGEEVRAVVLARDRALTGRSALTGRPLSPLVFTLRRRPTNVETEDSKPSSSPSSSTTSTSSDTVREKPPPNLFTPPKSTTPPTRSQEVTGRRVAL